MNVASWGTADQSTTLYSLLNYWRAQNALDGLSYVCTQTDHQTDPWWKLDLKKTCSVNRVSITNRCICCVNWIDGAEIRIGNNSSDVFSNPVCLSDISLYADFGQLVSSYILYIYMYVCVCASNTDYLQVFRLC